MSVRLLVKQRSQAGGSEKDAEVILNEETILLGRDKECQVVLAEQAVSRSHAKISRDGALCFLEDLGSAYGTLVNGKTLPKGEKRLLRNGDVIGIAQFDLTFDRIADGPKNGRSENTSFVARQAVKDVMRGLGKGEGPFFRIMNGPNEGQKIEIAEAQEIVFGREDNADVVLRDDLVSRRHAKVRRDWSGTHVEDLESRNGIKVNKKRITRKTLHDRDELEIGSVRLLYLDPAEVRESPVVLPPEDDGAEATIAQEAPSEQEAAQAPDGEPSMDPDPSGVGNPPGEMAESPSSELEVPGNPDSEFGDEGEELQEEEMGDEAMEREPGVRGAFAGLSTRMRNPRVMLSFAVMGAFAVLALVITILVLVGA